MTAAYCLVMLFFVLWKIMFKKKTKTFHARWALHRKGWYWIWKKKNKKRRILKIQILALTFDSHSIVYEVQFDIF